ncbi:hypothetical protein QTG56_23725 (plasmid) [Rossellomorea sp. AcN35-11]|nr:hypothetical protein [Rossellomorea aquimaris]WJV32372.1 hypothetical protein QTG56_23725 [Rossellomorea sp. AcN35-11]
MTTEMNKKQIDLFGDIYGEDSEITKSITKKPATPKPAAIPTMPKVEPKPPVKVHGDWKADFYGNVFDVIDYVEEIPEEGIEVEELRKEMQKDFFGLSKERAYWEIDEENKYIFLFQKGTSKGAL